MSTPTLSGRQSSNDVDTEERGPQTQESIENKARSEEEKLSEIINTLKLTKGRIAEDLSKSVPMLKEVESELSKLEDLCKLRDVLTVLKEIKKGNDAIEVSLQTKPTKQTDVDMKLFQAVDHFEDLKNACNKVFKMAPVGNRLREYSEKVLTHWNKELVALVRPRFESVLQSSGWPVTGLDTLPGTMRLSTNAFDNFFVALLKLELRPLFEEKIADDLEKIRVSLALQIMIEPLKKRFYYHFVKPSKTNQLEKPEWYLTQTLNWIKDNQEYLRRNVDPILRMQSIKWPPATLQLTTGLLELIRSKLKNDLEDLIYDERNFSHTFDEVYLFVKELDNVLGQNQMLMKQSGCDLFSLFLRDPFFTKLINLEKKKASEYVDGILESETCWNILNSCSDEQLEEDDYDLRVPEAADNFVILLQSIVERSFYMTDPNNRRAFVDLILEMLDDFRLRLSQLMRSAAAVSPDPQFNCTKWPFSPQYFGILNTLNYLLEVLEEWKFQPYFSESAQEGIFDETSSHMKHMILEMQKRIVDSSINQFRLKLYVYANLKWFCMTTSDEKAEIAACEVFHFLSMSLEFLKRQVPSRIFDAIAICFSSEISKLYLEDVILKNTFNTDGAAKIRMDVKQHLLSLFKSFMRRPESFLAEYEFQNFL